MGDDENKKLKFELEEREYLLKPDLISELFGQTTGTGIYPMFEPTAIPDELLVRLIAGKGAPEDVEKQQELHEQMVNWMQQTHCAMRPYKADREYAKKAYEILHGKLTEIDKNSQPVICDIAGNLVYGSAPNIICGETVLAAAPCYTCGAGKIQAAVSVAGDTALYAMRLPVAHGNDVTSVVSDVFAAVRGPFPGLLKALNEVSDSLEQLSKEKVPE
jgi:hypothetical protein